MGRPSLGPAKKSKHIALHVTEAQYDLIKAQGGSSWVRQIVLAALLPYLSGKGEPRPRPKTPTKPVPETREAQPEPEAPEVKPHRHERIRTGDHYVKGTNVGEFKCKTCGVVMGALQ